MSGMGDWIADFIPDDNAPPHKMRSWRKRLALVACSNWLYTFFALTPALVAILIVGLPIFGRVAWADETERKIKSEVQAMIEPVVAEQKKLSATQAAQGDILKALATASLRLDICRYAARRLNEHDVSERARLLDQITEMLDRYRQYSGREFNTADC